MQKGSYSAAFDTPDPLAQGLAIFDLTNLTWKHFYSANPGSYAPAPESQTYYNTNGRSPTTGFTSPALESLFAIEHFTTPTRNSHPEHSQQPRPSRRHRRQRRRRIRRRYQESYRSMRKPPTLAAMRWKWKQEEEQARKCKCKDL